MVLSVRRIPQEGQHSTTASAALHPTNRGLNPCTAMAQDPPPEEYDQMLAFYYKWQEKDRVCCASQ